MKSIASSGFEAPIRKSDADWKASLTAEQYRVTRRKGTEPPFTGRYWNHHGEGTYRCVCCGTPLFDASTKFESGTGWPSFYAPVAKENVREVSDNSLFMRRMEVVCATCDAHLGHVFCDTEADRAALLHELGRARVRSERLITISALTRPLHVINHLK